MPNQQSPYSPEISDNLARCIPIVLGFSTFLLVIGPRALYPSNIAWLEIGDPACYYLGWAFFRQTDWMMPLGSNPMYGLELANSIIYSDSNPLLAFFFKVFHPILPETFQYFGIWLLICLVLQAWLAWKLMELATGHLGLRALGTGLFLFAPPMLFRLHPLIGHLNLFAHFFILAGLYLSLRPADGGRRLYWALILFCATLVHTYLLAMVAALWLTDLAARLWRRQDNLARVGLEAGAVIAGILLLLWLAGFFTVGQTFTYDGYGRFRMNLLGILDPGKARYGTWSLLLPDLPGDEDQHEDFNFLGLGILLVAVAALFFAARRWGEVSSRLGRHAPLLCTLALLTVFSISHKIGLGPWTFEVPLPQGMVELANILRSSARMFWPAFYALLFACLFVIVSFLNVRAAAAVLTVCLAIQILDTSPGWLFIRKHLMVEPSDQWETGMRSDFWAAAAADRYSKIRWMPTKNISKYWTAISFFAATHGMATNAVYLARTDHARLFEQREQDEEMIASNGYAADTLYVFAEDTLPKVMESLDSSKHMLASVDGAFVVAPFWNSQRGSAESVTSE